nr:hypothetical protein [Pseudoxanthomonas sp.]
MLKSGVLALASAIVLAGCGLGDAGKPDPYVLLPGKWGWEGSNDCREAPEVISFSASRKHMYLALSPAREDGGREPRRVGEYRILQQIPEGLRMSLKGETRMDDSGQPVTWDLVLVDRDTYCWRRNDWGDGCTKPLRRCGVEA